MTIGNTCISFKSQKPYFNLSFGRTWEVLISPAGSFQDKQREKKNKALQLLLQKSKADPKQKQREVNSLDVPSPDITAHSSPSLSTSPILTL